MCGFQSGFPPFSVTVYTHKRNFKRLREFEEIDISRQSCSWLWIAIRKTLQNFVWFSSKNLALVLWQSLYMYNCCWALPISLVSKSTVERLYCKRPIQCLATSNWPPPPTPSPAGECVPLPPHQRHTRWVKTGWGGQYFGRRKTQLCALHM